MLNLCRYMYLSDVPLLLCCELFSWITNKLVEKTLLLPLKLNTGVSHVQQRKKSSLRAKTEGVFLIVTNTNNSGLIFQKQTECITFSIPRAFFFQRFNLKMIFISLIKVKKNKLIFRAVRSSYYMYLKQTVISEVLKSLYPLMRYPLMEINCISIGRKIKHTSAACHLTQTPRLNSDQK